MSAAISGMLPVSLPRFAANNPGASIQAQNGAPPTTAWVGSGGSENGGDGLDFDLLAEYLLDEGTTYGATAAAAAEMPSFDFSVESAAASGVVSPEQSEDGFPPISEAPPAQAPTPAATPKVAPLQPILAQPPPTTVIPQAPQIAAHPGAPQVQLPPGVAPAPAPFAPLAGTAIPAPIAAAPNTIPQPVDLAASAPSNKRRRIDAPLMAVTAPGMIINGHLVAHAMNGRGKQKTQAQIDRRRERNRILARRTRLRKKFFFESLQKEVTDLQRENSILKELAKKNLDPEASKDLLEGCKAMEQLPEAVTEACGESASDMDQQDFNLVQSIQRSQQCFVITDPSLQDNPIVYASEDFLTLTGYKREEVLGRNCRFLQGTETSPQKVEEIRKAITNGLDVTVTMINYTANGTAFWNKLFIAALRDAQNNIVNFIGVVVKVASPDPDDPEANKRLPGEQQPMASNSDVDMAHGNASPDPNSAAIEADGTVKAIEGVVSAAVAAAPAANGTNN